MPVMEGGDQRPDASEGWNGQEDQGSVSLGTCEAGDAYPPQQGRGKGREKDEGTMGSRWPALVFVPMLNGWGGPSSTSIDDQHGSDGRQGWDGQEHEAAASGGYSAYDADPPQQGSCEDGQDAVSCRAVGCRLR